MRGTRRTAESDRSKPALLAPEGLPRLRIRYRAALAERWGRALGTQFWRRTGFQQGRTRK